VLRCAELQQFMKKEGAIVFTLKKVAANRNKVCVLWGFFHLFSSRTKENVAKHRELKLEKRKKKIGGSAWAVKKCEV